MKIFLKILTDSNLTDYTYQDFNFALNMDKTKKL